jgi:hypothetical protein
MEIAMIATLKMVAPIAPIQVRWPRSSLAATDASDHSLAIGYHGPKNIGIFAAVIAELQIRCCNLYSMSIGAARQTGEKE